ncbi:MAG: right-handed parallel beta-helix repeat-containing protein [Oscillospiraceae bacterium]|nr:right-handed parallel beta-helix repeat-containing protein [Oscillospiraceae bacterium]
MIYHVSMSGSDLAAGTQEAPFRTINRAAAVAAPGDAVLVHSGVYREWVDPQCGGLRDDQRITYEAAPGEHVVIKGSEVVTGWERVQGTVWKKVLPNTFFGDWNPYAEALDGDWFRLPKDYYVHHGDVYINGVSMFEASSLEDLYEAAAKTQMCAFGWKFVPEDVLFPERTVYRWYAQVDNCTTTFLCNFQEIDPNQALIEINVRKCCFYPRKTGVNYITLRGFDIAHAACPFAPPTADQIAMVGPNWSKGWIIENNHLHDAKCCAISLGKEGSTGDNESRKKERKSSHIYQLEAVFSGLRAGWDIDNIGSHVVRNNTIYDCGQAGIVGHMGCAFSRIEGNHIYNIGIKHEFWGDEIAGIKFHAALDTQIIGNNIHHCTKGTWLDWQAQGTRLSRNLYHHNDRDLMIEVTHGPCTVDHNIFLSDYSLDLLAQGTAFVHNIIGGLIRWRPVPYRSTPYHLPHSTCVAGVAPVYSGDDRIFNNLFIGSLQNKGEESKAPTNMCACFDCLNSPEEYKETMDTIERKTCDDFWSIQQPIWVEENAYAGHAKPFRKEKNPIRADGMQVHIAEENGKWVLAITVPEAVTRASCQAVTTERLGMPRIVEQRYENPDGTSIDFAEDFFGNIRTESVIPGPFAALSAGKHTFIVWKA